MIIVFFKTLYSNDSLYFCYLSNFNIFYIQMGVFRSHDSPDDRDVDHLANINVNVTIIR
jgi:hypothetical protein